MKTFLPLVLFAIAVPRSSLAEPDSGTIVFNKKLTNGNRLVVIAHDVTKDKSRLEARAEIVKSITNANPYVTVKAEKSVFDFRVAVVTNGTNHALARFYTSRTDLETAAPSSVCQIIDVEIDGKSLHILKRDLDDLTGFGGTVFYNYYSNVFDRPNPMRGTDSFGTLVNPQDREIISGRFGVGGTNSEFTLTLVERGFAGGNGKPWALTEMTNIYVWKTNAWAASTNTSLR